MFIGCSDAFRADSNSTFTISGQVVNEADSQPVADAFVEITSPAELQQSTRTDSAGSYSLTIESEEPVGVTINVSKADFEPYSETVNVSPGGDIPGANIGLVATADTDSEGDGEEEEGQVKGEAESAAAIVLTSTPLQAINIKETGDVVSSPFSFQVQDSAGRPLDASKSVDVQFELINSPGGMEEIVPKTVSTDAGGQVTTTLFSGNRAGAVKLQATVERPEDGLIIKSSPVLVAIHGGFPDAKHFSIGMDRFNFEGGSINNLRNTVTVVVGDKFSNPVKPGTVVYFETTGGIIQGSSPTDEDGIAEVDLISGNPRPTDNIQGSDGRRGYSTVTARTVDENDDSISEEAFVVFSTSAARISASPSTFDLQPDGGASFSYTIEDLNGNPMATGTQISIDAGEGISLSGNTNFTLGNNIFPGPGSTDFNFSIKDTDDESNAEADLTLEITVTTPNGNITNFSGISGTRR
jgi:hypothetical protein